MPVEKIKSPVGIPSIGYDVMEVRWELMHDLFGGTLTMREAAQRWLPMEPAEEQPSYDIRLNRSILYNGLVDTVNKLKNRPFTHSITVKDLPASLEYLEDDVDGSRKPLEIFLKDVLENLITYGVAHIYVDHTKVDNEERTTLSGERKELTLADETRLGVRVYLINISPKDLIGWQTEKNSSGEVELIQIRIRETSVVADGAYGDVETTTVTVYNKTGWEIHKQDSEDEDKYVKISEGTSSLGKIPLVTIYATKTGFMTAKPPLEDLAWLNLAHWQSYSDQRNILRFSRFGLIFGKGLPSEMTGGTLTIGPTKAFLTSEPDADMKYIEHSGKSIEAGRKDLEDIEQKMRVLGNQPLMKDMPNTATAERLDEGRTVSQLQSWVGSLKRGIMAALELAGEWRKVDLPETTEVDIYSDFEAVILGGGDKDHILKARQSGDITRERYLREAQRRGIYSQDMDPVEEAKLADAEDTNDLKNLLPEEEEIDEELELEDEEIE